MSPAEAEWLLEEWAVWSRGGDAVGVGWPKATAFGRMIKPDPMPAQLPVEPDRAAKTDRVVAKLHPRRRYWVKLHFLDQSPIDAKARRVGRGREAYKTEIAAIVAYVARRLDETPVPVYMGNTAGRV